LVVERLGGKCVVCDEIDIHVLHVDHKYGQGYLEKEYFESNDDMFKYYIMNWREESKYIQVLCMNCNLKKRIENKETAGRPKLKELESYLLHETYDPKKLTLDEYKKKQEYLTLQEKQLEVFLKDNPQFVPIHKRMIRIYERIDDFLYRYSNKLLSLYEGLNWLPTPYNKILKSKIKLHSGLYSDVSDYEQRKIPKHFLNEETLKSIFE